MKKNIEKPGKFASKMHTKNICPPCNAAALFPGSLCIVHVATAHPSRPNSMHICKYRGTAIKFAVCIITQFMQKICNTFHLKPCILFWIN